MRIGGAFYVRFGFALEDERLLYFYGFFCADMLDLGFIFITKIVKTQAVLITVDLIGQFMLQLAALGVIYYTLKNRILHADSVIYAELSYSAESFSAFFCLRIYVVGY